MIRLTPFGSITDEGLCLLWLTQESALPGGSKLIFWPSDAIIPDVRNIPHIPPPLGRAADKESVHRQENPFEAAGGRITLCDKTEGKGVRRLDRIAVIGIWSHKKTTNAELIMRPRLLHQTFGPENPFRN